MAILAGGLANFRLRSMRADGKDSLGRVLRVVKQERQLVQRVEAGALAVPEAQQRHGAGMFSAPALEPLLRQAVVIIATAVETYVGDRVTELLSAAVAKGSPAAANERLP